MGGTVDVECPYCGETIPVVVDTGGGASQRYVEDCSVCCRPMELFVLEDGGGEFTVVARRADE
ncbi:MAG: hypothetical protein H6Q88_556 [Anaeromyxobacteraceae bacterium]|jgi:transposase-like protein|nr:hypothetical protein [Anaeromyxobacteraceae bacterium]